MRRGSRVTLLCWAAFAVCIMLLLTLWNVYHMDRLFSPPPSTRLPSLSPAPSSSAASTGAPSLAVPRHEVPEGNRADDGPTTKDPLTTLEQPPQKKYEKPVSPTPVPPVTLAAPPAFQRDTEYYRWETIDAIVRDTLPRTKKNWRPTNTALANRSKAGAAQLEEDTGCDVLSMPFQPEKDARCIEYLTDPENWLELIPLPARYDARTLKFQIRFRQPDLHSILKVPQRLFVNEAFAETAAYHADRLLGVNRVPPTGWACLPVAWLRNTTAAFGRKVEVDPQNLKDSEVKTYAEWVEKDLLKYAHSHKSVEKTPEGEPCIGASLQLHLVDVHNLLDTPLRIPYKTHSKAWHKYFSLREQPEPDTDPLASFISKSYASTIISLSETNTFDFIIANGDRSPNKNYFVTGPCLRNDDLCTEDTSQYDHSGDWIHPGPPNFALLDQGSAFYDYARDNPLRASIKHGNNTYCLFREPLLNRLDALATEAKMGVAGRGFAERMKVALPRAVRRFVSDATLRACQRRIEDVLAAARKCQRQSYGKFVVTT